jgi:HK97 family phage major capsid protein
MQAFGGLASVAETITTTTGEPLRWPTLDDTSNSGVIAVENAAPASGGADLVFGEKTLGAFKYVAPGTGNLPLKVSVELSQDGAFDIQSLIARKLSERIYRAQAADFVSGAGTTAPRGIIYGTATPQTAQPTYASLLNAMHSVDIAYRDNASWVLSDTSLAQIEALTDSTGRPLLNSHNDGINVGRANQTLLGYPVVVDNAFAYYAASGAVKWGSIAGAAGPGGVPAAVSEAGDVPDEDLIGAEAVPVGASRRRVGDPLPVRGLHQLAQHP